jgi:CheY-like chemotaxis protein
MGPASYHFIIVDDEEDARILLRRILSRCHGTARIFEAANGQEALKLYESHGADLMIIDHHVPLLDGLSLVRFLRAQFVSIPLILTSHNPLIEREAAHAGATRFLAKEQLFESLHEMLPGWLD